MGPWYAMDNPTVPWDHGMGWTVERTRRRRSFDRSADGQVYIKLSECGMNGLEH